MLCSGQLYDESIYKVKALCLQCFHDESEKFPSDFLQRFINLENLKMSCSSFTEIFSSGSFGTGLSETKVKLRKLVLVELKNLEFICKKKSEVQVLQNIEMLGVYKCSRLKSIVPISVLFGNLEQLMRLLVIDCPMMETFSHGVSDAPRLRAVHVKRKDEWHWNGDINSTIRKFVAKKEL
ncbi:hypothetical protein P8452_52414 [Trifolium repens]|nr:hypothetical protein P8452_52414 [Trifolium repens]